MKKLQTIKILLLALTLICLTSHGQTYILKKKRINHKRGTPIPYSIYMGMVEDFNELYGGTNCDNPTNLINNLALKVKADDLKDHIGYSQAEFGGVILYYIIDNYTYSYAIKGCHLKKNDKGKIVPYVNDGNFLILKSTGNNEMRNTIAEIQKKYFDYVCFRDNSPSSNVKLPAKDVGHPKFCFFSKAHFEAFYNQNSQGRAKMEYLHIFNGARFITTEVVINDVKQVLEFKAQTPILVWGEQDSPNIPSKEGDPNKMYLNRALDVGLLCPPDCDEVEE